MNFSSLQKWRDWVPVPQANGQINPVRWVLLEGNRNAVTGALLTFVFGSFMLVGSIWTFEISRLLTETQAVQTLLNTFLGGIILLVSIVVSINAIVLSHDMTSVDAQEKQLDATMEFRRTIGKLTEDGETPTDPASFLRLMGTVISERASELEDAVDGVDSSFAEQTCAYAEEVAETAERVSSSITESASGAEFGVLWVGLEVDYGQHMDRSRGLRTSFDDPLGDDEDPFEGLVEAFNLFATGREYFKTLYYGQEVSELSRTLLVISLPAILINASAILAINAGLLPDFWILGLPPLLTSVAIVFTVSLTPFVVLTSYMLRLSTVAKRTAGSGPLPTERERPVTRFARRVMAHRRGSQTGGKGPAFGDRAARADRLSPPVVVTERVEGVSRWNRG